MTTSGIYAVCNADGGMTSYNANADPKRLAFQFSRYKHVAKLLEGRAMVLEVGCGDGFASRIVAQHVGALFAMDIDPAAIDIARANMSDRWPIAFVCADFLNAGMTGFDAAFSLDLFEHVEPERGDEFLSKMRSAAGLCVIGTPSLESQPYASEISRAGHVNCVSASGLREAMARHWKHVFVLGLNDETLHTGFDAMRHYLIGIGCD